jgi:hypothetical protein
VPLQRDNRDERLARLEALMELFGKKPREVRDQQVRGSVESRPAKRAKASLRASKKKRKRNA